MEINHCLKSSSEQEEKEEREKYFPVENFFFFFVILDITRNYFLVTWASILSWKPKGVFIAIKCIETPRDL